VKSAIQTRFGSVAVNVRSSRSPALDAAGSETVVRAFFPRRTPFIPRSRMSRSMVQCATGSPRRCINATILRRP